MALTRNFLKSMGLTDEQVGGIIEAHVETVDGLKQQIAQYKSDAEKLPDVQRQLAEAKEAAKNSGDAAKIQKDFDDFKAEVAAERTKAAKEAALRKAAKDAGLTDAGITKAVKYAAWDKIELTDKGEPKDAAALMKSLKEEWAEYIGTSKTHGVDTPNPPAGEPEDYEGMSDAEYYKATYEASKKKG